ncbi:juvenile hormone esterase-like isoform X2 [Drosophila tropicalis]|uniref:juvenile hormone esterase-like isoform X2 n=1 Tax=Drosophila tropicalis TaxID=46794 RepID=UPI0035ABEB5A
MLKLHLPLVSLCLLISFISPADLITICPPNVGCMRGRYMKGYQSEKFEAFLGIPYAEPPLGQRRFRSPVWKPKWDDIIDATYAKPDCIQKNYLLPTPIIYGEEDCLYLNIYRPVLRSGALPVMVYIHGGGFFSGSAGPLITGPEYIMDTGEVILVTMAYRLGALGFLSTGDASMPGNFGLKDQHLVFKWIQNHIGAFDGDKKKVTIFGQSAGGVAAHMHLLNPNSENLFHNVISMSGTANVPFGITKNPLEQARKTAELCGIPNANKLSTAELANALRNIDVLQLINAGDGLKYWDVDPLTNYRPVVERAGPDSIIPAEPYLLMRRNYQRRPWLIGTVPEEGAVRAINILESPKLFDQFNTYFDYLLRELMEWPAKYSQGQKGHKTAVVVTEYFRGVWSLRKNNKQGLLDSISDRGFKHPLYKAIKQHYEYRGQLSWFPHYMYSFNYKGSISYASLFTQANVTGKYGVVHCDDLLYLFRTPLLFPDFDKQSTEAKVIDSFVRYIVNFARFGFTIDAPPIGPCGSQVLASRPNGICDYHEFINNASNPFGFQIQVNSKFPTEYVKLWQELLDEL